MNLSQSKIIGFIPSTNLEEAECFYTDKLGLTLIDSDDYALEYSVNNTNYKSC